MTATGTSRSPRNPAAIARSHAIRAASARAEAYAQAAGVKVARVRQINEQSTQPPRPLRVSADFQAAATVPVAPGTQEFRVNVNVIYDLDSTSRQAR